MTKDKISIIIPVYNVQEYIKKCLDSIVYQSYRNLEIICIDDGSTDDSGEICVAYAKNDPRFKIVHKSNGGYPSALNIGLDMFTGNYVAFVDPDDWIENNCIQDIHRIISNQNADIVGFGIVKDYEDQRELILSNKFKISTETFGRLKALEYVFKRDCYPSFGAYLCNKIYRREIFDSLHMDEDLLVGGDVLLFTKCILKMQNMIYVEKPYYHYLQRNTSLFHCEDLNKREGSLKAYLKVMKLLEKEGFSEILVWVKRFYVYHASCLLKIAMKLKNDEKIKLYQIEITKYLNEYIETNYNNPSRIEEVRNLLNYRA